MGAENNDQNVTLSGIVSNDVVGGALNVLFMGAGRTAGRAVGDSLVTVSKAIWQNTVNSVTSRAGNFMIKKLAAEMISNTVSSTVQSGFGKIFGVVMDGMGVY